MNIFKFKFFILSFFKITYDLNVVPDFKIFKKYGPIAHRFSGDLARNGKGEILILQLINRR